MNTVICIVLIVYLIVMSVFDIKTLSIPLWPGIVCFGMLSVTLLVMGTTPLRIAAGILVGGLLYALSYVSRGGIGRADALVYVVTGTVLGLYKNLEVLFLSLTMAAMVGAFLLIFKKVDRKYRLPFVPFTCVACGMVMLL